MSNRAMHDARMNLRRLRQQERLRRRLRAHAERTLTSLEINDDDVPLLREHADRVARIAERMRRLANGAA
jgi:hypothetical protein